MLTSFIAWCLIVGVYIVTQWETLLTLQLVGNDDYMRYLQFTTWLESGRWHLTPIESFNPNAGQLIHWSRLPDIPLALLYLLSSLFTDKETAQAIAVAITPLCYLLVLLIAVGVFTVRIANADAAKLAILFTLLSPLLNKFLPGAIDHHNIQLMLFALFLAALPIKPKELLSKTRAFIQGGIIALSFWVGMENLLAFAFSLLMMSCLGYVQRWRWLQYASFLCLLGAVTAALLMLLNRPATEFFDTHYDALSLPYVALLLAGAAFCQLSLRLNRYCYWRHTHRITRFIGCATVVLVPVLCLYPALIGGVYYNYPPLLETYWLDHVSEAKPIWSYIERDGILSKRNYLLTLLPLFIGAFFLPRNALFRALLGLALLLLCLPLLWQIRTIFTAFVIALPLQAYICAIALTQIRFSALRILVLISCIPLCIMLVAGQLQQTFLTSDLPQSASSLPANQSNNYKTELLTRHGIEQQTILAPIEFGAPILALTNNHVFSAPYHRNTTANQWVIEQFIATDYLAIKQQLFEHDVNYLLLGGDGASRLMSKESPPSSFINQLLNQAPFDWLELIDTSDNGVLLYKIRKE